MKHFIVFFEVSLVINDAWSLVRPDKMVLSFSLVGLRNDLSKINFHSHILVVRGSNSILVVETTGARYTLVSYSGRFCCHFTITQVLISYAFIGRRLTLVVIEWHLRAISIFDLIVED